MYYTDDINGTIVGGDIIAGWLTYDERPQCNTIYSKTKEGLLQLLETKKKELQAEYGQSFSMIYPDPSLWSVTTN